MDEYEKLNLKMSQQKTSLTKASSMSSFPTNTNQNNNGTQNKL